MIHKWLILQNISKDYEKLMGYVRLSINFVRSDQERATLLPLDPNERANGSSIIDLSIPPQIKLDKKEIVICLYRGENIVKMDASYVGFGGKADPYVKIKLGGLTISSSVKHDLNPTFMEKLCLPIIYPTFLNKLVLSFKDQDTGKKDDHIGSSSYKISEILEGKYRRPFWAHFYGAYGKVEFENIQKQMNKVPELASRFKGSLYMSIYMLSSETPRLYKTLLGKTEIVNAPAKKDYQCILDIQSISNLCSEEKKHKIEINWGGKCENSSKASFNNGVLEYFERIKLTNSFKVNDYKEVNFILEAS